MQPVFEMPDDAIPHLQTQAGKNGVKKRIKRDDGSVIYEVANLPANASSISQDTHTFGYHFALFFEVVVQMQPILIFLSQIIRR